MALSNIEIVRLLIGDSPNTPFYPLLSDEEIETILELNNNNIRKAAVMAAISISMIVPSIPIRERTGQIEVWSNIATSYLAALANLINSPLDLSLSGIKPWAGGISWKEVCRNVKNADTVLHPLGAIKDTCEPECGCENTSCSNCQH